MSNKGKKYARDKKFDPAHQAIKMRRALDAFEQERNVWKMEKAGIRNHFAKITNFTSHDVKNAIQNMDAVISSLQIDNVTEEHIATIKTCLNAMRLSLDDFYRLSFDNNLTDFRLSELANLVELLNKATLKEQKIHFKSEVDCSDTVVIRQPFHNILQILNNLVLNSIKAFPIDKQDKKILIQYEHDDSDVKIDVLDNACPIPIDIREKIFEMNFSATGGSGIGLAHSTYMAEKIRGSLTLRDGNEDYCTYFALKFPIGSNDSLHSDN